ncbi:SixA phosphatase family protein [Chrysiogenes arsenatis]|uniref:SixA phosphatase family protein n=1 Tax=Chrysiogenes arsenatis TaxID=309797 RepID=UPI0003FECD75|nr:histidine phosphatase family protein [Chrysiogenes arsenatis]
MKQVILLRHAKASLGELGMNDWDRPLNERGRNDRDVMAAALQSHKWLPDVVLCSSARRTVETLAAFLPACNPQHATIIITRDLYNAGVPTLLHAIQKLPETQSSVLVIAHNPGLTYFANALSDAAIDNLPTSGLFVIEFPVASWSAINDPGRMVAFLSPKLLAQKA